MAAVWFQIVLGPVETVDEIDSTNAELLRRAKAGAPSGLVFVARHQTAGRGRRDRQWVAPPGSSLLASVLLRPALPPQELHLVTFAAGLAAVDACRDVANVDLSLKWPNDVVVDSDDGARKVAGLLAESVFEGDRVTAVVVGMGLNVNWMEPIPGGASLRELRGHDVDVDRLLQCWLSAFEVALGSLQVGNGRAQLLERYRRVSSTLGRRVRVETVGESFEGIAEDVDDAGHLVVRCPERLAFAVGDVVHLRMFRNDDEQGTLG